MVGCKAQYFLPHSLLASPWWPAELTGLSFLLLRHGTRRNNPRQLRKRTDNHHFSFFFCPPPSRSPLPRVRPRTSPLLGWAGYREERKEGKKAGDERDRALLPGRNRVEEAIAFPEVGLPDESVFDKRGKTWKSVRHSRVPISSPHYTLRFPSRMPMQTSCPTRGIWGGEDK